MAEETGSIAAGAFKDSVAKIEIYTGALLAPDDWTISIYFENRLYDADGVVVGDATFGFMRVDRRFGDIKDDPDVVALMQSIRAKAYAYREADIAKATDDRARFIQRALEQEALSQQQQASEQENPGAAEPAVK
jgi:hypothetical protein